MLRCYFFSGRDAFPQMHYITGVLCVWLLKLLRFLTVLIFLLINVMLHFVFLFLVEGPGKGGGVLVQSFSSLTRFSLKRPGSLGLTASSNVMSKSTSEPMNLITDAAVSPGKCLLLNSIGFVALLILR